MCVTEKEREREAKEWKEKERETSENKKGEREREMVRMKRCTNYRGMKERRYWNYGHDAI